LLRITLAHIRKDFTVEFRSRFAVSVAAAFAAITTLSVSLAAGGAPLAPTVHAILYWIIVFFSAMSGLAHIFTREEEEGTSLLLRLVAPPEAVFTAKLIFNCAMLFTLAIIITPLYLFFLNVTLPGPGFIALAAAGTFAIAASSTVLAAIVARAGGKAALFTVISFPILLPVLWISIRASSALLSGAHAAVTESVLFLLAFSGALVAVSYMLFEHIWSEE
jgi:heme exporter protein B